MTTCEKLGLSDLTNTTWSSMAEAGIKPSSPEQHSTALNMRLSLLFLQSPASFTTLQQMKQQSYKKWLPFLQCLDSARGQGDPVY